MQAGSTVSRVVHLQTGRTLATQPLWHLSLQTPQLRPWEVTPDEREKNRVSTVQTIVFHVVMVGFAVSLYEFNHFKFQSSFLNRKQCTYDFLNSKFSLHYNV